MFKSSIIWKLNLPVPIALVCSLLAIWILLPPQIAENVRADAVRSGEQVAHQFKVIRGYYTQNVIKKAKASGALTPSIAHKADEAAIPLPATLIHDLSELLKEEDTSVSLYSEFPFPNRQARTLDSFQIEAWEFLNNSPDDTFVRQEVRDGQDIVRVAIADRMVAEACVDCHNSIVGSPKTDWQIGDVRGVLEVSTVIDEQLAAGTSLSNTLMAAATVGGLILIFLSLIAARSVSRPISDMTSAMKRLSEGDQEVEVPAVDRSDEIGAMAQALQVFKDNSAEMEQLRKTRETEAKEAQESLEGNMRNLTADLEQRVGNAVADIVKKTETMHELAERMSTSAGEVSGDSTAVAAAAEEATANVQAVASAAEEMASTIEEISRQVAESTSIASSAVQQAEQTNTTVQGLAEAAAKIGEVISMISDIAEQTNLLALNATIEAARAGEAGKGFAVVASEVKNLASQTAKATEDIDQQIGNIQGVTTEAVTAIEQIRSTIQQIDAIAGSIATSVDEQGGATQEIARSVQEAAAGNQEVTVRINQVSDAAARSGGLADEVRSNADNVASSVNRLQEDIADAIRQSTA